MLHSRNVFKSVVVVCFYQTFSSQKNLVYMALDGRLFVFLPQALSSKQFYLHDDIIILHDDNDINADRFPVVCLSFSNPFVFVPLLWLALLVYRPEQKITELKNSKLSSLEGELLCER